jgi:hypothetical protein
MKTEQCLTRISSKSKTSNEQLQFWQTSGGLPVISLEESIILLQDSQIKWMELNDFMKFLKSEEAVRKRSPSSGTAHTVYSCK